MRGALCAANRGVIYACLVQAPKPMRPVRWAERRDHFVRVLVESGVEPFWPAGPGEQIVGGRLSPYGEAARPDGRHDTPARRATLARVLAAVPRAGDEACLREVPGIEVPSQLPMMLRDEPRLEFFKRSVGRRGQPPWWVRRVG